MLINDYSIYAQSTENINNEISQLEREIKFLESQNDPDALKLRKLKLILEEKKRQLTEKKSYIGKYTNKANPVDGWEFAKDSAEYIYKKYGYENSDRFLERLLKIMEGQLIYVTGYSIKLYSKDYIKIVSSHHPLGCGLGWYWACGGDWSQWNWNCENSSCWKSCLGTAERKQGIKIATVYSVDSSEAISSFDFAKLKKHSHMMDSQQDYADITVDLSFLFPQDPQEKKKKKVQIEGVVSSLKTLHFNNGKKVNLSIKIKDWVIKSTDI